MSLFNRCGGGWLLPPLAVLALACGGGDGARQELASAASPVAPTAFVDSFTRFAVEIDPPAVQGAFAPEWSTGEGLALTWIEPTAEGHHRVRIAQRSTGEGTSEWLPPVTVTEGDRFFANWADFPAAVTAADGTQVVHWLEKNGEETYAYGPQLARSVDGGASWQRLGPLHDDASETEHGFVSWLRDGEDLRAFWLDGRAMADGGPMAIRTATLTTDRAVDAPAPANEVLDERICECCSTSAALAPGGPIVAYRDRSEEEIRDIHLVRRLAEGWSDPVRVGADDWRIPGCPVNGPAIDADGGWVAVAWFTAGEPQPRVQVAFSRDGGASFEPPIVVDDGRPLGRVDLVLSGPGVAVVSWLAVHAGESAQADLRLASVAVSAAQPAFAETVATTASARSSGFPRLARRGDSLLLAWVEIGEDRSRSRVRALQLNKAGDPSS